MPRNKYVVYIVYPFKGKLPGKTEFDSKKEADAYVNGVKDGFGWNSSLGITVKHIDSDGVYKKLSEETFDG